MAKPAYLDLRIKPLIEKSLLRILKVCTLGLSICYCASISKIYKIRRKYYVRCVLKELLDSLANMQLSNMEGMLAHQGCAGTVIKCLR
jgi:hypothetical protein